MAKKDLNFKNVESLQSVANVINEASEALNDSKRTIIDSPISDALPSFSGRLSLMMFGLLKVVVSIKKLINRKPKSTIGVMSGLMFFLCLE